MKKTRLLSAFLVLLLVLSLLPVSGVQAAKETAGFAGNRTVEFTFQSSDLDNYANGGRAAMDLYLRKDAPEWLSYTLGAKGYEVQLTYSFDFASFDDYRQKLAVLLTYQPGILYTPGQELVLVEEFDSSQLLGSLQQALGQSQTLSQWAKVNKDTLTVAGESYDFAGQKVEIYPQAQSEILLRSLNVTTSWKGDAWTRTVTVVISGDYTGHEQWAALVRRCEKAGDVTQEEAGDVLNFSVTFKAANEQALAEKTSQCLDMPVGLSVQLTEAAEDSCSYLRTESFLLTGYLEEDGAFTYSYTCPEQMENVTVVSENTELQTIQTENEDAVTEEDQIRANNQSSIKFSYIAPFRFDEVSVHTDWDSALKKVQRTVTLTAPVQAAQVYHETIKAQLSDAMPKGTVLEIYDQEQTRYYVLKFSSWFWADIEEFTAAFLDTEIIRQDSWLPMGQSSYTEEILDTNVLESFGPAHSVRVSYRFPGTDASFTDTVETIQIEYRHLNIIKLLVLLLGLAILVVAVLIPVKKLRKALKNRPVKEKKPRAAEPAPAPARQFCGSCGTELGPQDTFCPNCGSPRS